MRLFFSDRNRDLVWCGLVAIIAFMGCCVAVAHSAEQTQTLNVDAIAGRPSTFAMDSLPDLDCRSIAGNCRCADCQCTLGNQCGCLTAKATQDVPPLNVSAIAKRQPAAAAKPSPQKPTNTTAAKPQLPQTTSAQCPQFRTVCNGHTCRLVRIR